LEGLMNPQPIDCKLGMTCVQQPQGLVFPE
jgi:hypothetical protein